MTDILDDSAHEGFIVNNSVIANSFIRRVVRSQIAIGTALNITAPAYLSDILENLVELPTARVTMASNVTGEPQHVEVWLNESPGPASFQGKPWNVSIEPCLPGNKGWQDAVHCWNATGGRLGGLPSDHLAKYPLWPSEFISRADAPQLVATAQATVRAYSVPGDLIYGRDSIGFVAAVLAGTQPPVSSTAWTAEEIVGAMESVEGFTRSATGAVHLLQFGNRMGMGMSRAVEEMLVSAPGGHYVEVFPMWPRGSDASFHQLRVKGGFLVSANYSSHSRTVTALAIEAAPIDPGQLQECIVKSPWQVEQVTVACRGGTNGTKHGRVPVVSGLLKFRAEVGRLCAITPVTP